MKHAFLDISERFSYDDNGKYRNCFRYSMGGYGNHEGMDKVPRREKETKANLSDSLPALETDRKCSACDDPDL